MKTDHGKYKYEKKNSFVNVYLRRTAPGQYTKEGSYNIREKTWEIKTYLPNQVKDDIEKAFSV